MRELGHPGGLHVTAFDADTVSEANVGRQVFSPADVGQYKAILTIHRLNQFYGLDWDAQPARYQQLNDSPAILVSCVDSAASRRELHQMQFDRSHGSVKYWLDLGNTESTGQVVLGQPGRDWNIGDEWSRLPCVTELFPQLLDDSTPEDDAPSCSVRVSLASQGLFVNDMVVRWAAQLLYELLCGGGMLTHGALLNLRAKRCGPIEVDPMVWRRYGVRRRKPAERKRPATALAL